MEADAPPPLAQPEQPTPPAHLQPGGAKFARPARQTPAAGGVLGNAIAQYARAALKGERAQVDAQLLHDVERVLGGGAIYLPAFFCAPGDFSALEALTAELEAQPGAGMEAWSKHLKHENPTFSATFNALVARMAEHFDVDVYATRLNFYRDASDWKPWHHDSHAYGGNALREDFTMGGSFGAERELAFLHEPSGAQFAFPQRNGDVFAFDTEVNTLFKHGVPRAKASAGPRFSIIAGRRRTLNERNSGAARGPTPAPADAATAGSRAAAEKRPPPPPPRAHAPAPPPREAVRVLEGSQVSELVSAMLQRSDGGGADAASAATPPVSPRRAQSRRAKALRAALGEELYGELKALARAWQRGAVGAETFYEGAMECLGGEAAPLLELAAFLPDADARRELAALHAARSVAAIGEAQ